MALIIPAVWETPGLLVPNLKPLGRVAICRSYSLAPDVFVLGDEMIGVGHLNLNSNTTLPEIFVEKRTLIGRETTSTDNVASSSGTLPLHPQSDRSSFTTGTWLFKVTIEADNGFGPKLLYEESDNVNGLGFFYRTSPDKFSIGTSIGSVDTEIQFATTFTAYETTDEFIVLGFKYDGTNWYLYVNGILVETQAVTHGTLVFSNSGAALFGKDNGSAGGTSTVPCSNTIFSAAYSWYGSLDSFLRYDAALSDEQIDHVSNNIYKSLVKA